MSRFAIATAREAFSLLRDDLVAIEQELARDTASGIHTIEEIAEYLREGDGKRICSSLLLLSAYMLGNTNRGCIRLGAVVEMVHAASMVHCDMVDASDANRVRPSVHTSWEIDKCVLAGDWLYMQAFKVALEEKNLRVFDLLVGLAQQMAEGALLQIQRLGKTISEAEYYDMIDRETGCLFAFSMRLGAVLGAATEAEEASLVACGRSVGMAFQIVDDLLDLTAAEATPGRPSSSGLCNGVATLAVIHAARHGTDSDCRILQRVLDDRSFEHARREQVQEILARNGSIEYAMAAANGYAEHARQQLASIADSEFKRALLRLPELLLAQKM
jgi:octaprenyl-diphosphate synthase